MEDKNTSKDRGLRQKAEEVLKGTIRKNYPQLSEIDTFKFIHELEVHQIELELQNEELLLTQAAAQEAAQKYTELYDFAPFAYFTLSPEGQILELNFHGAQMLGKERSSLKNSTFGFFISQDTRAVFNNFLERTFRSKVKESCEVTLVIAGKNPIYVHLTGISIGDSEQCLINVMDITERKQAERTIIESQRLNAIGEMASSIAHDFNNSLQVISGNLELAMLNSESPEAILTYLKIIRTTVDDSAERIRSLQRFGKRKQDKSMFSFADVNMFIAEVIAQVRPLWKGEAEKMGLSFVIETKFGEIPEIFCDKGELRVVLYNLFKNSIEAMPNGGVIYVETGQRLNEVYIDITDTGIGMNEETKARIFQPFYSTKGFDVGRGLGMSGGYTIIKEHGGDIYVKRTAPGEGTTIEITLPILDKEEVLSGKEVKKNVREVKDVKEVQKEVSDLKSNVHILWVDDEDAINTIAGAMVTILGHKIDLANSGEEALKHLDLNTYDLVITDVGMPKMNGWQLADRIRKLFDDKIKIAIVSGWGDQITEAEMSKHGVDYKIDKPFNISQLKSLFAEVGTKKDN